MSDPTAVSQLFQSAADDGTLSPTSVRVLGTGDLNAQIAPAMGINVDDVTATETTLVTTLVDDSGSIRMVKGNSAAVREGHNAVLDALDGSKQPDGILAHCRYLNGVVLYPYMALGQAARMDTHNYDPRGGTPLYDQTVVTLATVVAKAQELMDAGVPTRTVTLIVTDGADQHSHQHNSDDVKTVVEDMLRTEMHIVAGMGIDDGGYTDFRQVFQNMGIQDEWILTPGNTPSEIRAAFLLFSQSAVAVSQTSGQLAGVGGFGS